MSSATPGRFASDAQQKWYGGGFTAEQSAAARVQRRERKAKPPPMATPVPYTRPYPPYLPGHVDPAWGVPIAGRDLRVGDVLVHIAEHYKIDRLEPYTGSLSGVLGDGARTAYSGTWDIAVGPNATIRILPREGK